MKIITKESLLKDISDSQNSMIKKSILFIPVMMLFIIVAVVIKVPKPNHTEILPSFFLVGCAIFAGMFLLLFLYEKFSTSKKDIRVYEDVVVDSDSMHVNGSTTHYILGLSGTSYTIGKQGRSEYVPMDEIYIIYAGKARYIYKKKYVELDLELKSKIVSNTLPSLQDNDAIAKQLANSYINGYTSIKGRRTPREEINYSANRPVCPNCYKKFSASHEIVKTCKKCGCEYRYKVVDIVVEKSYYHNALGETVLK